MRLHPLYFTVLSLGVCGLQGCNLFQPAKDTAQTYPTTPPSVNAGSGAGTPAVAVSPSATASSVVRVPANAQELSHGEYPPPVFAMPNQPGTILVVDMDGDPSVAVAATSVSGKDGGKQTSITDVTNMTVSMNKLHRYRIVFVPK